jgi:DNA ligase (NAD+)
MTQEIYNQIIDDLKRYSFYYYRYGKSLISDKEFDILMKQAEAIEKQHPEWTREDTLTKKPGFNVIGEKVQHSVPMLSLENTYNMGEVKEWYRKMQQMTGEVKPVVIIEPKYDGLSFAAFYVKGVLVKALTRGDGEYGEDITQNCRLIPELGNLKDLDFSGEVRGEIIMEIAEFERLNADGKYANPRNLAVGTIKLLDPEEFKKRKLTAYVYFLVSGFEDNSHFGTISKLSKIGFKTSTTHFCSDLDSIELVINEIEQRKSTYPVDIDGAVLKLDRKDLWAKIGGTSKFPHWAKAYKYEPDTTMTRVKDIEFWVGHTGKVTPVAIFEPVFLSGSTVSKATINNKGYMEALDIMVGDMVDIKKAAEIIPFINHVVKDLRELDGRTRTRIDFPKTCPTCNSKLAKYNEEHADYFCMNEECSSRIVGGIVKYTSEMEIDGFAETIVQRFYDAGILRSIEDLYALKDKKELALTLERMGDKTLTKLIENIENSKTQKLEKFIAAIGIKNVGTSTGKALAAKFKELKIIMGATKEELMDIDDIGETVADSIYNYFRKPSNRKFLTNMTEKYGLNLTNPVPKDNKTLKLEGKNFCITGALSLKRDDYIELIESLGGKVVGGVTKNTHYLITNDGVTQTTKLVSAKNLAIPILNEKELLELCGALDLLKKLNY